MNQLRGGYSAELRGLRRQLLELTSLMELELDFGDEEVEFADRSQFIIITHRPGTMEQCDSLFGVTMQKRGVSQMLKVKLVDAIEMAEPEQKAEAQA